MAESALAPHDDREEFPHIGKPEASPAAWRLALRAEGEFPTQLDDSTHLGRTRRSALARLLHRREGEDSACRRELRETSSGPKPRALTERLPLRSGLQRLPSLLWRPLARHSRRRSAIDSPADPILA